MLETLFVEQATGSITSPASLAALSDNFRVVVVRLGEELPLYSSRQVAVIVTDIDCAEPKGASWLDGIRRAYPLASLILVDTETSTPISESLEAALAVRLRHPLQPEDLVRAVGTAARVHETRLQRCGSTRPPADLPCLRVLVTEDNPGDFVLLEAALCENDRGHYLIEHAVNLEQTLQAVEHARFDIVVLDLSLPDATGLESVDALQKQCPNVPILVLSGSRDDQIAIAAVQAGAQDFLIKGEVSGWMLRRAVRSSIERMVVQRRLSRLAHYDQLTGLANRTTFNMRTEHALEVAKRNDGRRPAVLMLDVDRFKTVNDSLGHALGDLLLAQVAERLVGAVRSVDTVARLGGDEFAVLIEDVESPDKASIPAERILAAISAPFLVEGQVLRIGVSLGIAVFPENGASTDDLMRSADAAMYRAKAAGRNRFQFFDVEMHRSAQRRLALETDVVASIKANEFELNYQPIVNCASNETIGFEALLRWNHATLGRVSPFEFIPILEERGTIVRVGEWVMNRACEQIKDWQEKYSRPLHMAVNVSARQFEDKNLVQMVTDAVANSGIEPQYLELEVTEGLLIRDVESAARKLRELRELGVKVAIDDFGTGFSQLTYLVRFPISTLKIDRSVVNTIGTPDGNVLTTAVLDLAKNLGFNVVAEGVEEVEQLAFLKARNCATYQGYLVSRPKPASAVEDTLLSGWLDEPQAGSAARVVAGA